MWRDSYSRRNFCQSSTLSNLATTTRFTALPNYWFARNSFLFKILHLPQNLSKVFFSLRGNYHQDYHLMWSPHLRPTRLDSCSIYCIISCKPIRYKNIWFREKHTRTPIFRNPSSRYQWRTKVQRKVKPPYPWNSCPEVFNALIEN